MKVILWGHIFPFYSKVFSHFYVQYVPIHVCVCVLMRACQQATFFKPYEEHGLSFMDTVRSVSICTVVYLFVLALYSSTF